MSEGSVASPEPPVTTSAPPAVAVPPPSIDEAEERSGLARQMDVLLTTSSILAGFALTGLMSLAESADLDRAAKAAGLSTSPFAFPVAHFCTLVATIAFIGVLVGIVSSRLRLGQPALASLRQANRVSIGVFGLGLASLFCATITVGVPNGPGMVLGVAGGLAITFGLHYRVRHGI